jgi:hypothetical protein
MLRDDELAASARGRLTAGGRRAYLRQDFGAAVSLLERGASLVPSGESDVALETELGDALFETGRGGEALQRAGSLAQRTAAAGDRTGELCGRIKEALFRTHPRAGGRDRGAGRASGAGATGVPGRGR